MVDVPPPQYYRGTIVSGKRGASSKGGGSPIHCEDRNLGVMLTDEGGSWSGGGACETRTARMSHLVAASDARRDRARHVGLRRG